MKKRTVFPSIEEALYLHDELIKRFGGSFGILDKGLLESALSRPRSGYYESLSEQAAALMHSLVNNHCFVDGNKRVGFALTATFLLMNGYQIKVGSKIAEQFILKKVVGSKTHISTIATWLEKHMVRATIK